MATALQNIPTETEQQKLDAPVDRYLLALAHQRPFALRIQAAREHIVEDLEESWPIDPAWENEALALCRLIARQTNLLLDEVAAPYALLTIAVGAELQPMPVAEDGLALCAVFDAGQGVVRHHFHVPHDNAPLSLTPIDYGMVILCQPLERLSFRKDSVSQWVHHHGNIFRWTQHALNRLYDAEDEQRLKVGAVDAEKARHLAQHKTTELQHLRGLIERFAIEAAVVHETFGFPETPHQETTTSLSKAPQAPAVAATPRSSPMPPAAHVVERELLAFAIHEKQTPFLRATARALAQELHNIYSPTLVHDAAFALAAHAPHAPAGMAEASPHVSLAATHDLPHGAAVRAEAAHHGPHMDAHPVTAHEVVHGAEHAEDLEVGHKAFHAAAHNETESGAHHAEHVHAPGVSHGVMQAEEHHVAPGHGPAGVGHTEEHHVAPGHAPAHSEVPHELGRHEVHASAPHLETKSAVPHKHTEHPWHAGDEVRAQNHAFEHFHDIEVGHAPAQPAALHTPPRFSPAAPGGALRHAQVGAPQASSVRPGFARIVEVLGNKIRVIFVKLFPGQPWLFKQKGAAAVAVAQPHPDAPAYVIHAETLHHAPASPASQPISPGPAHTHDMDVSMHRPDMHHDEEGPAPQPDM